MKRERVVAAFTKLYKVNKNSLYAYQITASVSTSLNIRCGSVPLKLVGQSRLSAVLTSNAHPYPIRFTNIRQGRMISCKERQ